MDKSNDATYCFGDPRMIRDARPCDWTLQEIERLRTLAMEVKTPAESAQSLWRSKLSTKRKAWSLGIWDKNTNFWSNDEISQLRQLAKTHTVNKVAEALNRTPKSVESKAQRLGISFQKYGEANHATVYAKDDIRHIFEMRKQGATLRQMSKATGMHYSHACDILNCEVRYREVFELEMGESNG